MKFVTLLSLLVLLPLARGNDKCSSESACSCDVIGGGSMSLAGQTFNGGDSFIEVTGSDENIYRFYPCGVNVPWNGNCDTQATACQHSTQDGMYHSIGETTDYSITGVDADKTNPSVTFFYQGGTSGRKSTITVICDTTATDTLTFIDEYPTLDYNMQLTTAKICPGTTPSPSGQGGEPVIPALFIIVILVLFLATVTYLVVGVLLMVFWKGARGLEVIPNFAFWKDFPFLFKDGVLFSFSYIPAARSHIGGDKSYSSLK